MINIIPMEDWVLANPKPQPKQYTTLFWFDHNAYERSLSQWGKEYSKELDIRFKKIMTLFVEKLSTNLAKKLSIPLLKKSIDNNEMSIFSYFENNVIGCSIKTINKDSSCCIDYKKTMIEIHYEIKDICINFNKNKEQK